ncbi:hypothetical protein RxyAA322_28630 [Rubrobacter xylanophilus]|uniref:DUF4352 domain-containing protein n=1 Tax=Rubrobacter xylanophilus TaxID=49319 RepID=A0A510HLY0_9ACTN|nr:DUF4352 domain-containing protein [Rubrobacter xylanophilus]BBL81009.1 hypothetical protein RxyAA322_28630 [Rubrobacter xylanophilus]
MGKVAGILGIAALFVAAAVGTLAAGGFFGTPTFAGLQPDRPPQPSEPEPTAARTPETAVPAGRPVRIGDLEWTVEGASRSTELTSYTFPPETLPGSFVSVSFEVENASERPVTLTEELVRLVDGQGRVYTPSSEFNAQFVSPEKNLLFNEHGLLEPGASGEGRVNFEVASGASRFWLRITAPGAGERNVRLSPEVS